MNLDKRTCLVCRDITLHKRMACIHCGTVEAATKQPVYRDEIPLNEGKGVQASRKRGQANARRNLH